MKQQVLFDGGKASIAMVCDSKGKDHYFRLDEVSAISQRLYSLEDNLEAVEVVCGGVSHSFCLNCDLCDDLLRAWFFASGDNRPSSKF
ncbi:MULTISPECIES: hypothetical protein [Pantoea]|uniref:hypothetical protein n=1 Tax=Pantoea TaxID=53335 RepID=UPI002595A8F0|nr:MULTISPECIES: hypothetical protein [Pantoea]